MAFASTDATFKTASIAIHFCHSGSSTIMNLYMVLCAFLSTLCLLYTALRNCYPNMDALHYDFSISISSNNGLTTKNLTPEQRQQIINECVEDMISPTDLARKWNCNADTIRTWVRKAGLTLPKQYKKSIYPDSGSAPARAMGYGHQYHHILRKTLPGQFKYAHT